MSNSSGKGLATLLVGVAIGAGIGMLFAPEKGKITRKKIKDELRLQRDELLDKIAALSSQLNLPFSPTKIMEDLGAKGEKISQEVVEKLEAKFAELKDAARNMAK